MDIISVIIPVYNVEPYLERCVLSVINQTYKLLDIILINDGSTDRSGVICDRLKEIDNRIKVFHKENGGLSDARNFGIERAKGTYFFFLDSDDWITKDAIETLYRLLNKHHADLAVGSFEKTSQSNHIISKVTEQVRVLDSEQALYALCSNEKTLFVTAWGKLFHHELFNDIRYPLGKVHEDEFTTYKNYYNAKKIVVTNQPLLFYFMRDSSIMKSRSKLVHQLQVIEALEERAQFFNSVEYFQLSDITMRSLFFRYQNLNASLTHNNEENIDLKYYLLGYQSFKRRLKESNQSLKFKLRYRLAFLIDTIKLSRLH